MVINGMALYALWPQKSSDLEPLSRTLPLYYDCSRIQLNGHWLSVRIRWISTRSFRTLSHQPKQGEMNSELSHVIGLPPGYYRERSL